MIVYRSHMPLLTNIVFVYHQNRDPAVRPDVSRHAIASTPRRTPPAWQPTSKPTHKHLYLHSLSMRFYKKMHCYVSTYLYTSSCRTQPTSKQQSNGPILLKTPARFQWLLVLDVHSPAKRLNMLSASKILLLLLMARPNCRCHALAA